MSKSNRRHGGRPAAVQNGKSAGRGGVRTIAPNGGRGRRRGVTGLTWVDVRAASREGASGRRRRGVTFERLAVLVNGGEIPGLEARARPLRNSTEPGRRKPRLRLGLIVADHATGERWRFSATNLGSRRALAAAVELLASRHAALDGGGVALIDAGLIPRKPF